jgi:hypothetical protein
MSYQAMMRPRFKRPSNFARLGEKARRDVKELVIARLVMGLTDMQKSILETPVYTGKTLSNFRWSIGAPITSTRAPISEPARPGKTSELPLGSEPRRQANAGRIQEEFLELLAAVKQNPFQHTYLNNNLEHFSDVEYGTYAREGHQSRTPPGGMTRRGETLLEYSLMGIGRRV